MWKGNITMSEAYKRKNAYLMLYTREAAANEDSYPDGLARSIHMAASTDGVNFTPMFSNYGILFAKAEVTEENTLVPKCVKKPWVFAREEGYGIAAIRVNEDGSEEEKSKGKALLWTTSDFIQFEEHGLVDLEDIPRNENELWCETGTACGKYNLVCEDAGISCVIPVDATLVDCAVLHYSKLTNVAVQIPECVTVKSAEELARVQARAVYSDGSTAQKQVKWDYNGVDFCKPGTYTVSGVVQNPEYPFPLANGYGDPVILPWEGKYYFIATNDNTNDVGLYVREADTVEGLFADGIEQHIILDYDEERNFIQTFWAPEFHMIGGELYILFAVGGKQWSPQCHLMKFKKGGSIISPDSWEEPIRVVRKDGSFLGTKGITLDMTYIKSGEDSYMVWSYREHCMAPGDTGSMLYIASVDEKEPWRLTSEPVLLTRPLYGWENVSNTINNEGPYAFVTEDTVYLAYSGGSANKFTYAVGLLTAQVGKDLLDLDNWEKAKQPVLSFYSIDGLYGPGHNSFFTDAQGNLMIAYHGETAIDKTLRCDGTHRVHFNIEGKPVFDMAPGRDLKPELRNVQIQVHVVAEN